MPHERYPAARPRWFTSSATPCHADGRPLQSPASESHRQFVTFDLSNAPAKPFGEPLWADVVDFRTRFEELTAQLQRATLNVSIDHYCQAEWLTDIVARITVSNPIHLWLQVSTPDSLGGMRAGNDATDLAHGASELFARRQSPLIVCGFITTIDRLVSGSEAIQLHGERIYQRDRRLLSRSLEWAASEGKQLEGLQEILVPASQPEESLPTIRGDFIATVLSRPSLDLGVIDLGTATFSQSACVTFPDHNDITPSRSGPTRTELRLGYNARNLRIGDQVRVSVE